jgi:hypothetical protein
MLEVRKSTLYPTIKPSRVEALYLDKTPAKHEVLTEEFPSGVLSQSLIVES